MQSVTIVAIVYEEAEYQQTRACIAATGINAVYIGRGGSGSLAKAINTGIELVETPFAWITTNITFNPNCLEQLLKAIESDEKIAAVTPVFPSDHGANRKKGDSLLREVPFVEFTAPMVRTETMKAIPLDASMPYWGHDLDFGFRVRNTGRKLAVCELAEVGHTYIRFNKKPEPITEKRKLFRKETDYSTEYSLIKKYGNDWKRALGYL